MNTGVDINSTKLDKREFLRSLGLSKDAIEVYELLLDRDSAMTAQNIAECLMIFPSAVYRLFYELEGIGLLTREARRPRSYKALLPEIGFSRAAENRRLQLEKQLSSLSLAAPTQTVPAELVIGREALYSRYEIEAVKAVSTIDVHSIGIAYSKSLHDTQRQAIQCGVRIRHIVQEFNPSNFHVINSWKELGVDIRLLKSARGFHMMVFDQSKVIVSFSNPLDTRDRISIVTENATAVNLFRSYFQALWLESYEMTL